MLFKVTYQSLESKQWHDRTVTVSAIDKADAMTQARIRHEDYYKMWERSAPPLRRMRAKKYDDSGITGSGAVRGAEGGAQ